MMNLEMRDEGKKRRRSTAIPESSQDLPSEKKIKGEWVPRKSRRMRGCKEASFKIESRAMSDPPLSEIQKETL